ncbi:hypothetical protein Cadr_000024648 [Camelus dromedarius]|uniref:Immunoglobulin domain-containing protein n=1 Tax=Camelus dromedarius TaxID=9838 RepID=A0A5N4CPS9_CAMDR|nr:hypothetical protein Cadr_000024648 [Camelus dromedarius]
MCNPGANSSGAHGSGSKDSGSHVYLHKIQGGSVLFHAIKGSEIDSGAKMEKVSWVFGHESNQTVMLSICAGSATPTWVSLQDKYQKRVHVPNMTSLKIENLSIEDSGLYRIRVSFTKGIEFTKDFYLTVYGAKKDLNVTWESKGLPKELNHRGTLGPASNSWTLAVSLPLSQSNAKLTCVVNNQVDKKTASKNLAEVCAHGAGSQEDQDDADDSIQYVELSQQESRESTYQGISKQHLREKGPLTTIYSEVCKPGHAMKII